MKKKDYYKQKELKYSKRLKDTEPIIIRFDGIGVTKSTNLYDLSVGSFSSALKATAYHFAKQFNCKSFQYGSDEASFVFDLDADAFFFEKLECQKIASLAGQVFVTIFNTFYTKEKEIFFDVRCFNLPQCKTMDYLKCRQKGVKNSMLATYVKYFYVDIEIFNVKYEERLENLIKERPQFLAVPEAVRHGEIVVFEEPQALPDTSNIIDDFIVS